MSRPPSKNEKHTKGRPRRRATKTHFFKYQLSEDPKKVEQNDLRRALQESLEEQKNSKGAKINSLGRPNNGNRIPQSVDSNNVSKTNYSDISSSCNSSSSTSTGSSRTDNIRRTRSGSIYPIKEVKVQAKQKQKQEDQPVKRPNIVNGHLEGNNINHCDNKTTVIRTYSRSQPLNGPRSSTLKDSSSDKTTTMTAPTEITIISTPKKVSTTVFSTQGTQTSPPLTQAENGLDSAKTISPKTKLESKQSQPPPQMPPKEQYLTPKRESKSDAYAKISAMNNYLSYSYICNTSGFTPVKRPSPSGSLSEHSHAPAKVSPKNNQRRVVQSSWTILGVPEEKLVYLRNDEPPKRLICYPAIKHIEGDVIQIKDSVLLRSGANKADLPYIAKVCAFWQDATTGGIMMSLLWYYRPEHTEEGRKSHHLIDEIFASRHRDVDSVDCIEDKCYVLTFNEYCRYKKRCKMDQAKTNWSLTDVTVPVSNDAYPRRNRIPDSDVNPELVFCCRQIYDSRMKKLIKNPLINPKYGHI